MSDKDFQNFLFKADELEGRLKDHPPGPEAGNIVFEFLKIIINAGASAVKSEVKEKVKNFAILTQPKVISVDWASVFMRSLNGEYNVHSLRHVLDVLWTVGGPRAIAAFFKMHPKDLSTIRSLSKALAQLDPAELGTEYHLPVVIDQMIPQATLNYEPVAALLLDSLQYDKDLLNDPLIASITLVHAVKSGIVGQFVAEDLSVLQDGARTLLNQRVPFTEKIITTLAKTPLSYEILQPVMKTPALIQAIAAAKSTALLNSWCQGKTEKRYADAIDAAIRADLVEPLPIWSTFITTTVGQDQAAFSSLIDYMFASKTPQAPPKSLRIVAAVALLTQTAEPPTDRPDRAGQVQALQLQLLQDYPRLINYGQGHDDAIMANSELPTFSADIEAEMKLCFQRMYEQQHDIQEVIAMLERLKQSDVPRDQDLFACMIHSLFDEYRFFPQYPVKALATTAVLFGSLVHFRLIEGVSLAIALKHILDALRQDVDSNMFRFGLQALVELRQRLPEMPKYCKVLLSIPGLQKQNQFYSQIKSIADPASEDENVALFRSVNPIFEDEASNEAVPEESVKKISLIVNNLTVKNISDKAQELLRELSGLSTTRFAKIIVSRSVNEPNYHSLYAELLDLLPLEVATCCIDVIISRVAYFFNAPDATSTEKRNSVKNLGQMLGLLTLARDRPVVYHQLNLKLLLAEGMRYEKISAVLPFVAKLLQSTAESKVFGKTSPWLSSILAVLSELYWFGSLKLNLKFEIEVLGTAINVDIAKIEPAVYIRDETKQQDDVAAIAATFGGPNAISALPQVAPAPQTMPAGLSAASSSAAAAAAAAHGIPPEFAQASLPPGISPVPPVMPGGPPLQGMANGLPGGIPSTGAPVQGAGAAASQIGSGTPGVPLIGTTEFVTHPGLRQMLDLARSKTLQDVLLPVIDRSVSIASFTAKEIVLKDLALEPDESVLQAAAHAEAVVLASSMAIVTAKDPFIEALAQSLRTMMVAQGYGEAQLLLDQVNVAARETLESLVPLIESVAREKVIVEVDDALLPAYTARQRARAYNRPFEPEDYKEPPIQLPELLSVRKGGLLPEQMAVYEQFALQTYGSLDAIGSYTVSAQGLQAELQQLSEDIGKLENLTKDSQKRLGDHDKDDEVLTLLSDLVAKARSSAKKSEDVPLCASHLVVHTLFGPESTRSSLYRESLCYILGELCRMSGITAKEVVLWLLYADDSKKYNANVIGTLLRSRLVTPTEIDASLTKDLTDAYAKPAVVDYAARLLLDALIGPEPYCLRSDFAGSILALSRLNPEEFPAANILVQTLHETRGKGVGNEGHVFAEWTRLMQHHATANSPALLHAFIKDLHTLGWGSSPEQLLHFIQTAIFVSVKSYVQSNSFVGVDAVAVLITTLLTTVKENKKLARSLFAVVTLLIAKDHESGSFEALPYFRLMSSIACSLPICYIDELVETLLTLQPLAFPGFVSSWITLISHRFVMGRLLSDKKHWPKNFELLSALLMFLRHFWLSETSDAAARSFVYRGAERICLVILHDEPEFFIRYANETTAMLIFEFVQLRNLVLCAFPKGTSLPHPVAFNDIEYADVHQGVVQAIEDSQMLLKDRNCIKLIENACMPRPQLTPQIVSAIQTSLAYAKPVEDRGVDFDTVNVSMKGYNAFATYVGHLYHLHPAASGKVEDSSAAQLCGRMILTLSRENRYAFIHAVVNHLRYAEKHTYFFSRFILALFTPFGERMFKEGTIDARQIVTRVMLERLMAHRPHPWGLMATFTELLKNPQYNFWEMPFMKSSPEICGLFTTLYSHVSRTEVPA